MHTLSVGIDSEFEGDYDAAAGFGFHAPINNWADFTGEMLSESLILMRRR